MELYIPINHRRLEHLKALASSRSAASSGDQTAPLSDVEIASELSPLPEPTVRRVPVSQLSFFPPPTHKSSPPSHGFETPPLEHERPILPFNLTTPGGGLTSFLTSFPDTLARLSNESLITLSSTVSNTAHFHGGEGVELAVVKGKINSRGGTSVRTQQPIPVPQMMIRRPGVEAAREISNLSIPQFTPP